MNNETTMTVSGNVTRPPKILVGRNGKRFISLNVAVNQQRFDSEVGRYVQVGDTTFVDVLCFKSLGANVLASVKVGTPVVAYGKMTMRSWKTTESRGTDLQIMADNVGIAMAFGTAEFTRGCVSYPDDEQLRDGPAADAALTDAVNNAFAEREPEEDPLLEDLPEGVDADGVIDDELAEELAAQPA